MPVLKDLIDVLTMKSDRPVRRLVAYYVIVAIIVAIAAYFFPQEIMSCGSPRKASATLPTVRLY
jgi:hypothetical protein